MRRTRTRGPSYFTVGLIALVVMLVGCYLGFTKSIPFRSHYEVSAVFQTTNNIRLNSPVRVAGVNVGTVTKISEAAKGGEGATVTMRFEKKGLPLHKDATFKIRPRIFLEGNFFVDVSPGTPTAPEVDDDHVFPVNQTDTPVQLDEILTALQSDTREDLRTLLKEYASALKGDGARGYNRSVRYWKPAYRDSAIVAGALLGEREGDLSGYIASAGKTAQALDRNANQLKSLITDFNTTARAFAVEDGNLQAAVHELPRTLRAAQPALGALNAAFPSVRGFARDLRPGVRSSLPAIAASRPFVAQLRALVSEPELKGLVRDLRPTVTGLTRLSRSTVPFQREGRRLAGCQNDIFIPWGNDKVGDEVFPANSPVYQEFAKVLPGLAGESRSGDANGQWFRILLAGGTNLIQLAPGRFATSALPIKGANPPKPPTRPPLNPDAPCENQERADLRSTAGAPPPQRRIDTSDPKYQARLALAKKKAITWLEGQIKYEGLAKQLTVSTKDATEGLIDRVAADAGKAQVEQLQHTRSLLRSGK
ncbi:MAG TPA: MlaD family protein [Solirubrobacteraceae bacterium]|jgi:virulence factor Mce-like protein